MQTIADKMLEAFEAALSSTLGPGMHATYDSLVAPVVSATFPDFAAGYAAQFMPPVQAQYYTICMSLARASAYVATSLLLYIIGLALWVGAYYDKRNIRALLMVCGCLVAIADTAYTMNTFTEARFEIVPANWAAAIAMIAIVESFKVASSCLQVTVLLTNWPKTVKMVPYFLAAVCIAYIVSVTVIQTADLTTVCDYYPCTARSRWIFITLPILYVLFFAGIWCQRIWAHYRKMGTMSTGSRMTMVRFSSFFFRSISGMQFVTQMLDCVFLSASYCRWRTPPRSSVRSRRCAISRSFCGGSMARYVFVPFFFLVSLYCRRGHRKKFPTAKTMLSLS